MTQQELIESCKNVAMDLYSNDMEHSYELIEKVITTLEENTEKKD